MMRGGSMWLATVLSSGSIRRSSTVVGRDAGGDQAAALVEGDRDAAGAEAAAAVDRLREEAQVVAERARVAVGVALVGVVVHGVAPVGRHERMARDARGMDAVRLGLVAGEGLEPGELALVLGDRDRRERGGGEGQQGGEGEQGELHVRFVSGRRMAPPGADAPHIEHQIDVECAAGPSSKRTPVISSDTSQRRRATSSSRAARFGETGLGWPRCSPRPSGPT